MKSRILTCITAMTLFAALAVSVRLRLAAEEEGKEHARYKLIDLETLGGPNSSVPIVFDEINGTAGAQALSNQGTVAGTADTSIADPLCFFDDCFYPSAFQWQNGVLTNLGALPGSQASGVNWISDNGLIAGTSENGETDPLTGLPELRAVLWQGGEIADLGTLPGDTRASAQSLSTIKAKRSDWRPTGPPIPTPFSMEFSVPAPEHNRGRSYGTSTPG